ncbi:hypothetical protein O181_046508 [Austropuccinia psidii MF-1]|uniref:Uncharacterized protein n=1 Tax=Austropuccinia psidii MF-1 TaxID=1389203 RepID=A0A9Q3DSF5_9BASI|nr:hypothetical protein [Austropuccinia psidii MF-1]
MPIQHSPAVRQTRSQARAQAVLTSTSRAPLYGTPAVPQMRTQLDRGPHMEGVAPSRKEGRGPRRSNPFSGVVDGPPGLSRTIFKGPGKEEEENSVEGEESEGTEGGPAPVRESQGTGRPTLAHSNQYEPSLLAIMQQMTQIMANLEAAPLSESSRPPAFKTSSIKAPEFFDGTQPFKVRSFIQYTQLILYNYP